MDDCRPVAKKRNVYRHLSDVDAGQPMGRHFPDGLGQYSKLLGLSDMRALYKGPTISILLGSNIFGGGASKQRQSSQTHRFDPCGCSAPKQ